MENTKRVVPIRFTQPEYERLRERSEATGLSIAELVRWAVYNSRLDPPESHERMIDVPRGRKRGPRESGGREE